MYVVRKEFRFEAAHKLLNHDGKCARLHGHSFRCVLECRAFNTHRSGPKEGMVIDFGDMSAAMAPILDKKLDHYYLNETLGMTCPTSENIAKWLYTELLPKLPMLYAVEVAETCTSSARYHPFNF